MERRRTTRLTGPPQLAVALEQAVEELARNAATVGQAQADILLVGPVEITSARFKQAVAVGQPRILLYQAGVMVAVDDLEAHQSQVHQVLHDALELRIILRAELDRVRQDRHAA